MSEHLYAYQQEGAQFLVSRSCALLADEPGLGKTAQAIAACDRTKAERILVLCPAVAKENWRREFMRWSGRYSTHVQYGTSSVDVSAQVIVANYELLISGGFAEWVQKTYFDVLILDEAHYLKNVEAKRTRAVYGAEYAPGGLKDGPRHIWALTGTPAPNHAGELWPHLRALHYEALCAVGIRTHAQFIENFCLTRDTLYGVQITGSKNLKQLSWLLKDFMLRRKKADVLKDLPPLRFAPEPLSGVDLKPTPEMKRIIETSFKDDETLAALRSADVHLATERRLTGMLKAPVAAAYVADMLRDNRRKVLVFAIHNDVIEEMKRLLLDFGPVVINGQTPTKERQAAMERFQTDPTCRVFIGNVKAAGTAITLTAANDVVFVEASFTPSDNFQAACRCHRIGQNDAVLARMLYLPGSIDETVQRILARKANDLVELFG